MEVKKEQCTGCGACYNSCPTGAISMIENEEGFLYPKIDNTKCVNCGLCEKKCPILNEQLRNNLKEPECYAVMADDEVRKVSSSGGMFTLLANYVLEQGGCVCGAAYRDDWSVHHIIVDNKEDLQKLRGSKYLQSDTEKCYTKIKILLDDNKKVLFTGCPCQVAGLYSYLGKDYENLLTMELLCHGTPSYKIFKKYLEEEHKDKNISRIEFRDKALNWCSTNLVLYHDENFEICNIKTDPYEKGFHRGLFNRHSCAPCKFAKLPRSADITVADWWGINKFISNMDDKKGTSLVLINNPKAEIVYNIIKKQIYKQENIELENAKKSCNVTIFKPLKHHRNRTRFFKNFDTKTIRDNVIDCTKDKFDVGIIGFWYGENYGSLLTYYALNKTIEKLGKSVLMIKNPHSNPHTKKISAIKANAFGEQHYNISKIRRIWELSELNTICDTFVLGSDQVWRPSLYRGYKNTFFLGFANKFKRKIAYAASFGLDKLEIPTMETLRLKYYLKKFNAISVREKSGINILKNTFNIDSQLVLDPIFLCSLSEYENLIKESNNSKEDNYVLSYILDPTNKKKDITSNIKNKLNKKNVFITDFHRGITLKQSGHLSNDIKETMCVPDFLAYYKNSDFVITDSFHGTCLAIIFKKPFISIANPQRGTTRFESLLSKLNLMDRLVYKPEDAINNPRLLEPIDYDKVYEILDKEKERSLKWIEDALNSPIKEQKFSLFAIIVGSVISIHEKISNNLDYAKYKRYKILSKIYKGEKKIHYQKKSNYYHNRVRANRKRTKIMK